MNIFGFGSKQDRDAEGRWKTMPVAPTVPTAGKDATAFTTPVTTMSRKQRPAKAKGVRGSINYPDLYTQYNILLLKKSARAF
jgi:hypothetical protein